VVVVVVLLLLVLLLAVVWVCWCGAYCWCCGSCGCGGGFGGGFGGGSYSWEGWGIKRDLMASSWSDLVSLRLVKVARIVTIFLPVGGWSLFGVAPPE
jgi:hypothetical protein